MSQVSNVWGNSRHFCSMRAVTCWAISLMLTPRILILWVLAVFQFHRWGNWISGMLSVLPEPWISDGGPKPYAGATTGLSGVGRWERAGDSGVYHLCSRSEDNRRFKRWARDSASPYQNYLARGWLVRCGGYTRNGINWRSDFKSPLV